MGVIGVSSALLSCSHLSETSSMWLKGMSESRCGNALFAEALVELLHRVRAGEWEDKSSPRFLLHLVITSLFPLISLGAERTCHSRFSSFCTRPCVALQQVVTHAGVLKSRFVKRLHQLYNRHLYKVT